MVLRAAGDQAFSTGVDRKLGRFRHPNPLSEDDPGFWLGAKQNRVWKPLIVAVHGMCAGGAFYWLNECDVAICSEDATFFDPHTTYGMASALEPAALLRRIPFGEVMRMALFGNDERISAARALAIGLVTEVVSRDELWERADVLGEATGRQAPAGGAGHRQGGVGLAVDDDRGHPVGAADVHPADQPEDEDRVRPRRRAQLGNPLMRISLRLRYTDRKSLTDLIATADEVGLHGVWISEPWGYDCSALLGWCAAHTDRLELGTHVSSVYARSAATIAGLAGSVWSLTEGRFRLGLGVSGPAVVEGWHGAAFDRPVARTRDTVAVIRQALSGEPVSYRGETISIPRAESDWRPLRFALQSGAAPVPIYLAALGPANQRLTAEIADGWTPTPYSPDHHQAFAAPLLEALEVHRSPCATRPGGTCRRRHRPRCAARARTRLVGVVPGFDGRVLRRGGTQNGLRATWSMTSAATTASATGRRRARRCCRTTSTASGCSARLRPSAAGCTTTRPSASTRSLSNCASSTTPTSSRICARLGKAVTL